MATKQDVISAVANEFNETKSRAEEIAGFVLDTMYEKAMANDAVSFGPHKFIKKTTAPRRGRNPQTGESMQIPEKIKVAYKRLNR